MKLPTHIGKFPLSVLSAAVLAFGNVVAVAGLLYDKSVWSVAAASVLVLSGALFLAVTRNLHRQAQSTLHVANHDSLTGLMNRAAFGRLLEGALSEEKPLAVMVMDLNRFKAVNDTLGHPAGDVLLQEVAKRLTGALRDHDYLCRLGGDEFAVLLTNYGQPINATTVAGRLLATFNRPFIVQEQELDIGASIGIATFPENGDCASDLMKRADVAMYIAKTNRLGFSLYDAQRDVNSLESITLRTSLRQAVENGQIEVAYQPKKSLVTGRIVGIEALARWNSKELGPVPPSKFIPLAEQTGLIRTLTENILVKALDDFNTIPPGCLESVSVNISPYSLSQGDLVPQVAKSLAAHNLPPSALVIEITETSLSQSAEGFIQVILCLDMLGLSISIDDFGMGQSSLLYLRALRVSEIKIDRSFISNIGSSQQDRGIVQSIINLAHSVGCIVCAEGVESREVEDLLRNMGCDLIQGFYVSKPLPLEQLIPFLQEYNKGCSNDNS